MQTEIIETKRGRFLVFSRDEWITGALRGGDYGPGQVGLLSSIMEPDWVIADVGANVGALTVPLARHCATVHAFEPQRAVYYALCANVLLNGLDNVHCHNAAVGERRERVQIAAADHNAPKCNLGGFAMQSGTDHWVDVVTLVHPFDLVKIDVEGHELEVLRGAEPMIREAKPVLYVENDRRDKADELIAYIRDVLGYVPYWHISPINADVWAGTYSMDMLCLPFSAELPLTEANVGDFSKMVEAANA